MSTIQLGSTGASSKEQLSSQSTTPSLGLKLYYGGQSSQTVRSFVGPTPESVRSFVGPGLGSTGDSSSKEQLSSQSTTALSGSLGHKPDSGGHSSHSPLGPKKKLQKFPSGQESAKQNPKSVRSFVGPGLGSTGDSSSKEQFFSQSTTASYGLKSNSGGHSSHWPLGHIPDSGGHSSHVPRSPR